MSVTVEEAFRGRPAMATGDRAGALDVECLTTFAQIRQLRGEWDELVAVTPSASLFQTWAWVIHWFEHFAEEAALLVVVVRTADGRLIGIAPGSFSSLLGIRLLSLLGYRHQQTEITGAILHPAHEGAAAQAIVDAWYRHHHQWDLLVLPMVASESALVTAARLQVVERGYQLITHWQGHGVRGPLAENWDTFFASLHQKTRKTFRNLENRLERNGATRHVINIASTEALDVALDRLFTLHRERAQADLTPPHEDRFRDATERAFIRAVAHWFLRHRQLALSHLEIDGVTVAAQLCVRHGRTLYRLDSGYDPAWSWYGVMTALFRDMLEQAMAQGCTTLELLIGTDSEKLRWGGRPRPFITLVLASPRARSRAAAALFRMHSALERHLRRHQKRSPVRGLMGARQRMRAVATTVQD